MIDVVPFSYQTYSINSSWSPRRTKHQLSNGQVGEENEKIIEFHTTSTFQFARTVSPSWKNKIVKLNQTKGNKHLNTLSLCMMEILHHLFRMRNKMAVSINLIVRGQASDVEKLNAFKKSPILFLTRSMSNRRSGKTPKYSFFGKFHGS